MSTLKQRVLILKRRFKYVTKNRFFYVRKSELKGKSTAILCWLLVESKKKGVFIFEFKFTRSRSLSYRQWSELWTKRIATRSKKTHSRTKGYKSLYEILREDILPNISAKYRDDWRFIDLVGWSFNTKPLYFKS